MAMLDCHSYLITSVEDIVVFLGLKAFNSNKSCMFSCKKMPKSLWSQFENNKCLKNPKQFHNLSDKACKGTLVNPCHFCIEGCLKLRVQSL